MASPFTILPSKVRAIRFEGLALEAAAHDLGPGIGEAHIGRPQGRDGDAAPGQQADPGPVRTEPRPAPAAERQDGGVGIRPHRLAGRIGEGENAVVVKTLPAVAQGEADTEGLEPRQPGAQERRGLEGLGEHAPARSHEGLLSQALAPGAQVLRTEGLDQGPQLRPGLGIAGEEIFELLRMGQVQPAPSRHEQLAPDRRHPVVDRDGEACASQNLRGDQAGRAGADDGDFRGGGLRGHAVS